VKTASRKLHRRFKNRTRAGARQRVTTARRACTIGSANCVEKYDSIYETASDPGYIDEPVIRVEPAASETLYYHRNQQYSVTAHTGSTGAVVERYAYSAYGEPKFLSPAGSDISNSQISNIYTYTGREWDKAIGLYHFRARMYDSESGRFCGRDPVGYQDGPNSYRNYFSLSLTDPSGEFVDSGVDVNVGVDIYWGEGGGFSLGYQDSAKSCCLPSGKPGWEHERKVYLHGELGLGVGFEASFAGIRGVSIELIFATVSFDQEATCSTGCLPALGTAKPPWAGGCCPLCVTGSVNLPASIGIRGSIGFAGFTISYTTQLSMQAKVCYKPAPCPGPRLTVQACVSGEISVTVRYGWFYTTGGNRFNNCTPELPLSM
jgi:RHS repeat-associated protein